MARLVPALAAMSLAIVALLCVVPSSADRGTARSLQEVWPPKAKCDREQNNSPLRLVAAEPVSDGTLNKFCFTVLDDGICTASSKCCNKTLGVHKVSFQVDPMCKKSVRKVTIDGVVDPGYEFNLNDKTLRITGINAPNAGQEVCVFVANDGACSTRESLFPTCTYSIFSNECDCCPVGTFCSAPSPPFLPGFSRPPPPPGSFPVCDCIKDNTITQYTINAPATITPVAPGVNKACFNVNLKPFCSVDHVCCDFDLHKIEIDAVATCKPALMYTSINGKTKPRFFQVAPYPAVKITQIGIPVSAANNTEICLFLRSPCDSLTSLCPGGVCQVAIYNDMGKTKVHCCPVLPLEFIK